MAGQLNGKVAFITGIARGQGRAHAVALAEEGADIIGIDRAENLATAPYPLATEDDLAETVQLVEQTGRRAVVRRCDVRDRAGVERVLAESVAELGRLDVVVANAGMAPLPRNLWEITAEEWDEIVGINLTGVFNTLAVSVPHLLANNDTGSIIVVSSGAALINVSNLSGYVATKHGVIGMAKSLANELCHRQIRVNVIAPGSVGTPMLTANEVQLAMFRPDLPKPTIADVAEGFKERNPMGRPWLEAEDISRAVVYLAGDDSRWITGVVLPVDQGAANRPF